MMPKEIALALGFMFTHGANATLSIPNIINPQWDESTNALAKAGLYEFHDDLVDEKTLPLNDNHRHEAKVWQLTEAEEQRYLNLMRSKSTLYYHGLNMTPVDILGLNARDDAERAHFATLAARHEAQKVAQNIAWNNAFHQAYNQLFKDIPVVGQFDPTPFSPHAHQPITLNPGAQLYLFIKPDDSVKSIVLQLIDAIQRTPNSQLHVLCVDMDNEAMQRWANQHQLPMLLIAARKLTLNPGQQQFDSLSLQHKKTPLLLLAQEKQSQVVDLGRF